MCCAVRKSIEWGKHALAGKLRLVAPTPLMLVVVVLKRCSHHEVAADRLWSDVPESPAKEFWDDPRFHVVRVALDGLQCFRRVVVRVYEAEHALHPISHSLWLAGSVIGPEVVHDPAQFRRAVG